jgi:2-dehydropantoate 2-reductase
LKVGVESMDQERVLIVGTGAMACLFAARLAPHVQVIMLGTWDAGLDALRKHGVRLVELDGSEVNHPVRVTCDPCESPTVLSALVLVKSWQTKRAAEQLQSCLAPEGLALTLQNGIGNLEQLQKILGPKRATLGVTTVGATLLGPGHVRMGGKGPTYFVPSERLATLVDMLRLAGFEMEQVNELEGLMWGKLAINAGINPLTALLRVPNGELPKRPDARVLMLEAAKETALVAKAKGIKLCPEDPESQIVKVARRTAENHSSMYQDIQRGAPTEVNVICGEIVREGQRFGVPTPVNETFWRLIRALVNQQEEIEG